MNPIEAEWTTLAKRTATRLRWGTIVHASFPMSVIAGLALLGLGIASRLNGWEWTWPLVILIAVGIVLSLSVVFLKARRMSGSLDQPGFVRLDCMLGLHNALSSAAAGRGKWPALPANPDDRLRFNWKRILPPWLLSVLLAAAGLLIPLPAEAVGGGKIPPPRSHEEIAALIADLDKVEALKKEDLRQLEQQLDEIRNQPAENWYSHSSLEAADHLQNGIQEQLQALESGMNKAASSLAGLEKDGESSAEQQRLAGEFKAALQGLKSASPGLNQKLMASLSAIDPANLKSLVPGDLGKMIEDLKDAAGACKNCQGHCRGGRNGGNGDAQSELADLLSGENFEQEGNGRGGVQRGPGVAPLPLSRSLTELATDKPESLQTEDFSRARPGDAIGTADTEHQLDKTSTSTRDGGAAAAGQGGEAVSRDALLPSEKAVLKSYFR